MPFTSGSYALYVPGNPVITATPIASTWANNTLNDIATGLSTCLLKDGTQTVTANIPFAGFRLTGIGAGTLATDAARISQVQNMAYNYLTSVTGTNTVTGTAGVTPSAYAVGQIFYGIAAATNTGATTMNVSSLGGGAVQWQGAALTGGELVIGMPFALLVSAATPVFQIISPMWGLPVNSQSAAYPIVLSDAGKLLLHPTADNNPRTFTIPGEASINFPVGTCISFQNQINVLSIAITSDVLTLAGVGSTGTRAIAASGLATVVKVASANWIINGAGIS